MAEPKDQATVEVADEGVVTVDVTDNPELAATEAAAGEETSGVTAAEPEPKVVEAEPKKKVAPRVKLTPEQVAAADPNEALKAAVKAAEDRARAAEATAVAERNRADSASALAERRGQEVKSAQEQAQERELAIITSGIENATKEIEASTAEMTRALEAGEFAKVTAAQNKLSKANAALDRLENAKANFDAKVPSTEGAVTQPQVQTAVAPFEQYVSSFAPKAQAWLRQHPDCAPAVVGGDAKKNAKMMAGHYDALAKGLTEGSEDYFKTIEEHTGYRTPEAAAAEEEVEVTPAPKPKPKIQPSAPISREVPNSQGQVPRTTRSVTLSKEQQDMAKVSFPHLKPNEAFALYARNLIELEAEGKLGRTSH